MQDFNIYVHILLVCLHILCMETLLKSTEASTDTHIWIVTKPHLRQKLKVDGIRHYSRKTRWMEAAERQMGTGVSSAGRKMSKNPLFSHQDCRSISHDWIIYRWLLLETDGVWQDEDRSRKEKRAIVGVKVYLISAFNDWNSKRKEKKIKFLVPYTLPETVVFLLWIRVKRRLTNREP